MKPLLLILVLLVSCLCAIAETAKPIGNFQIVKISEANGQFALTHLEAGPSPVVLKESIKNLDHAIVLIGNSLSFVPPKRIGQYKNWILFPRLERAKDDLSFSSGFAIQVGSKVLQKWHGNTEAEPVGPAKPTPPGTSAAEQPRVPGAGAG